MCLSVAKVGRQAKLNPSTVQLVLLQPVSATVTDSFIFTHIICKFGYLHKYHLHVLAKAETVQCDTKKSLPDFVGRWKQS